jgi:ribosomal protein L37AE/L43A
MIRQKRTLLENMRRKKVKILSRKKNVLLCPQCGKKATSVQTKFGIRNEHCGLWSWGNNPLVDVYTHAARKQLHAKVQEAAERNFVSTFKIYHVLAVENGSNSWKAFQQATNEQCLKALKTLKKIDELLKPIKGITL